ncbi:hypothetical protein Afe04nite_17370 [Asanoa ferruginea]|nr:hypothetical protein Afe04nite_17370 [Asanoa ferruginea]
MPDRSRDFERKPQQRSDRGFVGSCGATVAVTSSGGLTSKGSSPSVSPYSLIAMDRLPVAVGRARSGCHRIIVSHGWTSAFEDLSE